MEGKREEVGLIKCVEVLEKRKNWFNDKILGGVLFGNLWV